mmetsp:Transcript_2687/g.4014  ORF Transcript_2687/g.4014 Transcript_2687/m.4014 type:complete len:111 (+) Transcript_2687:1189-1521(+)
MFDENTMFAFPSFTYDHSTRSSCCEDGGSDDDVKLESPASGKDSTNSCSEALTGFDVVNLFNLGDLNDTFVAIFDMPGQISGSGQPADFSGRMENILWNVSGNTEDPGST